MKHLIIFAASALVSMFMQGCAIKKPFINSSEGTVRVDIWGEAEDIKLDEQEGLSTAKKRCEAWGYTGAEPIGGPTKVCSSSSGVWCSTWRVTAKYQCTPPPSTSMTPGPTL